MIARNPLEALAQRPLRFLKSFWTWRSLAYLLSSVVPGAVVALLTLGLYYLRTVLGVPAVTLLGLLALLLVGWAMVGFERRRLRLVITNTDLPPSESAGERTLRRRILGWFRASASWRNLGYGVAALFTLWWIDLGITMVALGVPVFFLTAPLQPTATPLVEAAGVVVGALLLPISAYPIAAWAGARSAMTRAVLLPPDSELTEVVRSRARLADAYEVERRRIERDLHDGAQQRLVALSMKLGLAGLDLQPDSPAARHVSEAQEQAQRALEELRELIHNVHPRVLTDRGLEPAVRDLVGRSPVPVDVSIALPRRLDSAAEVAAYFVVCEGLANIAKHSTASRAWVHGQVSGETFVLEVGDDGVGGADIAGGTGLVGMADRLAVVDGRMLLRSPAGGPTVLRVEMPCNLIA